MHQRANHLHDFPFSFLCVPLPGYCWAGLGVPSFVRLSQPHNKLYKPGRCDLRYYQSKSQIFSVPVPRIKKKGQLLPLFALKIALSLLPRRCVVVPSFKVKRHFMSFSAKLCNFKKLTSASFTISPPSVPAEAATRRAVNSVCENTNDRVSC